MWLRIWCNLISKNWLQTISTSFYFTLDYYSESNWNVQSRNGQTDDRQNKPTRQYNQDYSGEQNQRTSQIHESFNQQYGQLDQQNWNNYKQIYQNVGLLSDLDSDWSSISQSKSQADYVTKHAKGDAAYEVERNIARKMVKIYNIIQKYAAKNGTVLTNQAQDPLPLRQWAVPTSSHQFLNMYAGKISGLSQGILQSMYFGNKQNIVSKMSRLIIELPNRNRSTTIAFYRPI